MEKYRGEIEKVHRTICERYEVEIIEANACPDPIDKLRSMPPKMAVTRFMGIRKGKSTIMIFDRLANGGTGMGIGTFRVEDIL